MSPSQPLLPNLDLVARQTINLPTQKEPDLFRNFQHPCSADKGGEIMIICMMNDSYYRASGSAIAVRRIAESLIDTNYFIAGAGDRLPEDLSWIAPGRYRQFDLKNSNPVRTLLELKRFKSWFTEHGCDLVHCHHRRLAVLLELVGIPVLYTAHNAFPRSAWFRWLHPRRMTAVTPSVAENILANTGTSVLAVIGNPTIFPVAPPSVDLKAVKRRAVCIARLDPVKGHTHLLTAWKLLLERGYAYELDLVGEGPLRWELEQQARRDGLLHLVQFCGFSPNVTSIIETSLFAILVSETEGQGIVTLEAAAAGRASLLTAVPGSIDLLPPERRLRNGLGYGNVRQLADTLQEWFDKPAEVVREGLIFFDFLKRSSEASTIGGQYEQVYRDALGTSGGHRKPQT
jgi:glycosyltransferase involved in cell wall biosynthesis